MSERDQPQKHELYLKPLFIDQIRLGLKTIESRIDVPPFRNVKERDIVKFSSNRDPKRFVVCGIDGRYKYDTFREMLEIEGVQSVFPHIDSIEEAVTIFKRVKGYSKLEKEFGVLALGLVPLAPRRHHP